jgi:hypothetical protein
MLGRNEREGRGGMPVPPKRRISARWRMFLPALLAVLFSGALVAASKTPAVDPEEVARLQFLVGKVKSAQPAAVARALDAELANQDESPLPEGDCLVTLGSLSEGKMPVVAFKRTPAPMVLPGATGGPPVPHWRLFLLAWNGRHWKAYGMLTGFQPISVRALPPAADSGALLAATIHSLSDGVLFPVVFRAPKAALVWDSRGEESRYEGHRDGEVRFQITEGQLEMVERGRADPGLLIFSGAPARGFQARSTYVWKGDAFVPRGTEYAQNQDFALYRFIAALHLHDYRAAYALVDAQKFLNTSQPDLKLFQERIQKAWPEFLDDRIFRASPGGAGDWTFTMRIENNLYVYTPAFSDHSPWLLTGLARRVEKLESE